MKKCSITMLMVRRGADSAASNRIKAIAKGFCENGIDFKIYAISDKDTEKSFLDDGINFKNLSVSNNNVIAYLTGLLRFPFIIWNSDVLWIEQVKLLFIWDWWLLFRRKGSIVLHEKTELPELIYKGNSLNNYLDNCKKFDKIFVISTALKKYFISQGIDEKKIFIYPMLIDPSRFECKKKSIFDFPYFAYCGDMGNNKDGVYNLIDAFSLFTQREDSYKLVLIGDAKPAEFTKLKQYVVDKKISDRVVFTGRIPANDIPTYLSNAKSLLLARPNNIQAKYGFPTKLGEYLATGNPIIVTDTGDIAKYLGNKEDAYIVEPDNINAFADKMLYVVNNYEEAKEVGLRGQRKIYLDFNYRVQTKKLIAHI